MHFTGHYEPWIQARINVIEGYFGQEWFAGKGLLELGCGYAAIGEYFHHLGAQLTCVDARKEHVDYLRQHKPFLNALQHDLDTPAWPFGDEFDLVIHTGVLYHLKEYQSNLLHSIRSAAFLFLETEVLDSNADEVRYVNEDQGGYDQAFNGVGCRPSVSHLENLMLSRNAKFERCFSTNLNADFHKYDWEPTDSKTWVHGQRRAWFVRGTGGKSILKTFLRTLFPSKQRRVA